MASETPNFSPENNRKALSFYEKIPEQKRQGNELLRRKIYRLFSLNDEQIHQVEFDLQNLEQNGRISTANSDTREWEWKIIDIVRYVKKWPLPPLSEWQDPVQSIEIVIHPLYGLFHTQWDKKLWRSCEGNVDKYIFEKLIAFSNEAAKELKNDPACFPDAYFIMRDVLEEIDALRTPPQPGQLRILDLPRRAMLSGEQIQTYDQFLKTISPQQTVAIDSMDPSTGMIQSEDLESMKNIIGSHGTVEFQGGYLNACIDAAVDSFARSVSDKGRKDIDLFVDTNPSTGMITETTSILTKSEREKMMLEAEKAKNIPPEIIRAYREFSEGSLALPESPPKTISDMKRWIDSNRDFNAKYDRMSRLKGEFFTNESFLSKKVAYKN